MIYKYLSIWIDENVSFKNHVTNLVSKLRQNTGFFFRNKSCFPLHRKTLVEATFLSVFDYGDILYRHASAAILKPLDAVYHSALRFNTGDAYITFIIASCTKRLGGPLSVRGGICIYICLFKRALLESCLLTLLPC